MGERAGRFSMVGAVLTALAASACCLGPMLLAAIGIGGLGAASVLGAYRTYWLAATAVLLGAGYYFAYRPRQADACGCERSGSRRTGRIALWGATVIVVLVAAAPSLLARLAPTHGESVMDPNLAKAVLHVPGADCEGCVGPMRKALDQVGGVHDVRLDVGARTVAVTYEPEAGRVDAYVAAIRDLGYDVALPNGSQR